MGEKREMDKKDRKKRNACLIKLKEINCNQIAEFSELMKCTNLKI